MPPCKRMPPCNLRDRSRVEHVPNHDQFYRERDLAWVGGRNEEIEGS